MHCILNVATNSNYVRWQERLSASLDRVGYKGRRMFWTNALPPASPSHSESPYAFKLYAIKEAIRNGVTQFLWLDSGMYAIRPVDPVFEILEREGVYLMRDENKVAKFCSQETLDYYGMSRSETEDIHLVTGSMIGLNMNNAISKELFVGWCGAYKAGLYRGTVSKHSGQEEHRGDETILGILAHRMGIKLYTHADHHASDRRVTESTIFRSGYYERAD